MRTHRLVSTCLRAATRCPSCIPCKELARVAQGARSQAIQHHPSLGLNSHRCVHAVRIAGGVGLRRGWHERCRHVRRARYVYHTPRAMPNTNLLQPLNVLYLLTVYCTLLTSGLPWNMRACAVLAMHVALVAVSHQLKQFTLKPVWGNEGFSPTPVMMASCVHARVQCKRRSHTRTSGCEAQGCRGVLAGQADPSPGCLKITRQGEIAVCCGAQMSAKACTSTSPAAFVMAPLLS